MSEQVGGEARVRVYELRMMASRGPREHVRCREETECLTERTGEVVNSLAVTVPIF